MSRPRTKANATLHPAKPDEARKAVGRALMALNPGAAARRVAEVELAASEARSVSGDMRPRPSKSRYALANLSADPVKAIVYERREASSVLARVHDQGHVRYVASRTHEAPLAHLFEQGPISTRIDTLQYKAGLRYEIDVKALAQSGSNTAAIIEHLRTGPIEDAEYRQAISDTQKYGTGYGLMRGAVETKPLKDPTTNMLGVAWRLRNIRDKMDGWELSVLDDLSVAERTLGMIAQRWGVNVKAMSLLARLALWKLARVYEETDHEFAAMVGIERQLNGEARQ